MLKAGFARMDVTPPFGTDISGYFYRRLSDGILDPLYANALAVGNGTDTAVMIAVDYIGIMLPYIEEIRPLVSKSTGIPEERILIACLHQHTSPCLGDNYGGAYMCLRDEEFISVACRKIADVAKMAVDDMKDATMGSAALETEEPIGFVRRYFADDGKVYTNPSSKLKLVKRCAEADNTMRLIRFFREGANDIALINFSTHPDVIGGTKYSADWPGFVRRFVESELPDVSAIFFTGCQGDSNHIDFFKPKAERYRSDMVGSNAGYEFSRHMGRIVANAVEKAWDATAPIEGDEIDGKNVIVFNMTNTENADKYDEYKAWYEKYEKSGEGHGPGITELAYAQRIIKLRNEPIFRKVPLSVIKFGGAALFGFGGEAFTAYGQMIRDIMPDKFVICSVCANGYEGYFPTEEAFAQGGYEAAGSFFTPSLEREIREAAEKMR